MKLHTNNSALPTVNERYLTSFHFKLSFSGEDAGFQEVRGISKAPGGAEVVSDGENRFKYRLPTLSSSDNLVLRRGLIPEGSLLIDCCSSCLADGLTNQITTQDIGLSLLDASGVAYVKWIFHRAYPIKYAVCDLKSQENGIVIEFL